MAASAWIVGNLTGTELSDAKVFSTLAEAVTEAESISVGVDSDFQIVRVSNLDGITVKASQGVLTVDLAAGGTGGFGTPS